MGNIEKLEIIKPDPDVKRLTEKVIDQNTKILEMNARLLVVLSSPMAVIQSDNDV